MTRRDAAMVYDPLRRRVVYFGGTTFDSLSNETWEWDGTRWRQILARTRPTARGRHMMAFDPATGTVLLFGGGLPGPKGKVMADTWRWDGRSWKQLAPPVRPEPRRSAAMCADPLRKRVVLFGGLLKTTQGTRIANDTWEWDGRAWRRMRPKTSPPPRELGSMAYCRRSKRVVLFGGTPGIGPMLTGTWEWDGVDWRRRKTSAAPQPRIQAGMAADPTDGSIILHGGYVVNSGPLTNDTWRWDGNAWTRLRPKVSPPVRSDCTGLASFDARSEVVLFGGIETRTGGAYAPTWIWKQNSWKLADPGLRPMDPYAMVYDGVRDRFIVWSGVLDGVWLLRGDRFERVVAREPAAPYPKGVAFHPRLGKAVLVREGRTWLTDGATFIQHRTGAPAGFGASTSMAYDSHRDRIVVLTNGGPQRPSETWEWEPVGGWVRRGTTGPPRRGYGTLRYDPVLRRTILFGGLDRHSRNKHYQDTWEWDGTRWRQRHPKTVPGWWFDRGHYMPGLGGVVIFGVVPGMYRWDGNDWRPLPKEIVQKMPIPITTAYDEGRDRLRVIARTPYRWRPFELWNLERGGLSADQPYPRPGETITLGLDLPGEAWRTWVIGLSLGTRPGVPLVLRPNRIWQRLPLRDDALLRASLSVPFGGLLDGRGRGSLKLSIPANPWLVGFEVYAAAVTLDARGGVRRITNAQQLGIVR